jgi:hypothetical protein
MSEERGQGLAPDDADDLSILDELLEPELDEAEALEDGELPEEPSEDEPPPEPRRQPSARQRAAIRLRKRLEETETENRRLRELTLTQTRQPAPAPVDPYRQMELERLETERVAQMMPHEQAQHYARLARQESSREIMQAKLEVADLLDRQAFDLVKQQEPMAARLANQIEQALAVSRQNNMNPTRVALYNQIFAEEVRSRAKKQAATQRERGRRQIAAQTTAPGGSRSSAAGARRQRSDDNSIEAVEARLRNVTLGDVW